MLSAFLLAIRMLYIYLTLNHQIIAQQYITVAPQYITVAPQYITVAPQLTSKVYNNLSLRETGPEVYNIT